MRKFLRNSVTTLIISGFCGAEGTAKGEGI